MRALTPVARAVRLVGRSRRLTWAQAAWAAYITAEQGLEIALVVFAYDHGGIAAAGLLAAARSGASAVTAPFTAGLGDRFEHRLVLVGAALLTSAVVACMSLASAVAASPWPVYVLAAVAAMVIPVYRPVQAALLPRLSETPAQLTAANVIVSMLEGVGNLAGPMLVGGLILAGGASWAFLALAALSLVTAASALRVTPSRARAAVARPGRRGRQLLAGFATVVDNADVRVLIGTFSVSMLVWGAFFQVLVVAVAVQRLGAAQGGAGLLASAAGVGAILGAIGSAGLVGRPRLVPVMAAGLIAWSAALVALAITTATVVAYAMVVVTGTGLVLMDVVTFTLLQRAADDRLLARVFGVLESLMRAAIGLGALAVAALASVTTLSTTLVLVGALQPIGLLVAWRGLSRVDRLAAADPARIRLLRSVELFSFLPPAELERVAGHLQRIDADAGDVLMRQGDRGDRVFLVESGTVEVISDGFHVTDLGPGSLVGEIALLRDVPRTATVRVADPAVLYALDRDEFLRIVTGDVAVAGQAGAIADARLGELGELQA
jgi:MFS family permease